MTTPAILAVIAALVTGVALGYAINRFLMKDRTARAAEQAERLVHDAEKQAETLKRESLLEAKDEILKLKGESETENKERRKELQVLESRLSEREASIDRRAESLDKREHQLSSQAGQITKAERELEELIEEERARLEQLAGMTADQARQELLARVQDDVKRDAATYIRESEIPGARGSRQACAQYRRHRDPDGWRRTIPQNPRCRWSTFPVTT